MLNLIACESKAQVIVSPGRVDTFSSNWKTYLSREVKKKNSVLNLFCLQLEFLIDTGSSNMAIAGLYLTLVEVVLHISYSFV